MLESCASVIARVVAAHLRVLRIKPGAKRALFKYEAVRGLLRLGLPRERIHDVLHALDMLMTLPRPMDKQV